MAGTATGIQDRSGRPQRNEFTVGYQSLGLVECHPSSCACGRCNHEGRVYAGVVNRRPNVKHFYGPSPQSVRAQALRWCKEREYIVAGYPSTT